jgi:uncharacterized protein YyaL (SSP411 family)
MKKLAAILFLTLSVIPLGAASEATRKSIAWQPWSDGIFEQARRENKFILLDLEAIWCHWCHVMDETSYKDPSVIALIASKYIAVRVDQDSRPDLSNRYEDYGWPATVVFNGQGQEIVKRSGYIPPRAMSSMLRAIIADPTPGPSVQPEAKIEFGDSPLLSAALREDLEKRFIAQYDTAHGSWGFDQKYLDWSSVEYAMAKARTGDAQAEHMARQTLDAQHALLDPVWGGVYQYSVGGDWKEPHFEKIMAFQAENLRIYALAYAQFHEQQYLDNALAIERFLRTFLTSPDGAFYTSQDADLIEGQHSAAYFKLDDAGRRKLGVPRVDKHVYARENGWAINALATLYGVTGDRRYLDEATRAAEWIASNRTLPDGGFRHGEKDAAGPYLGDTLSMARAFLTLYSATGDRAWLTRTEQAIAFIQANFKGEQAGYVTSKTSTDRAYTPRPLRDENISLARTANLLARYTGNDQYRAMAELAMKFLATPAIARAFPTSGVLLANLEVSSDPLHVTIVGHKDDPVAGTLFATAAALPSGYKRIEWWDKREGNLPNPDVQYPELSTAAAFVCTQTTCSSPLKSVDALKARLARK